MSKHRNSKPRNYGLSGGLSKHRTSGKTVKPPKLRYNMALEAQRTEIKAPPPLPYKSVSDVFRDK